MQNHREQLSLAEITGLLNHDRQVLDSVRTWQIIAIASACLTISAKIRGVAEKK